ncbi:MAG: thermonuclease family protein [Mycoplasmatales bacterium]|nr:thermonuclease family protein [Mycoplasmatales bacterium]
MKKIFSLTFGTLLTISVPLITIVSCGKDNTNITNSEYMYSRGSEVKWNPNHKIKSVHDGDTFQDEKGTSWRLFSVDTPEVSHNIDGKWISSTGIELLWGNKATDFVADKILNKEVMIASKNKRTYQRVVGAVFYRNKKGKIINLAIELVKLGLARIGYISKPNHGNRKYRVPLFYYNMMHKISDEARRNKMGYFGETISIQHKIYPKQNINS